MHRRAGTSAAVGALAVAAANALAAADCDAFASTDGVAGAIDGAHQILALSHGDAVVGFDKDAFHPRLVDIFPVDDDADDRLRDF